MSTVKSLTALLVGAAILDGAIASVAAPIISFLHEMAGTAYEGVTLAALMAISSGVAWDETYSDPASDVNRYSRSPADKVPGGVLRIMAAMPRRHAPGTVWNYNSARIVYVDQSAKHLMLDRRRRPIRRRLASGSRSTWGALHGPAINPAYVTETPQRPALVYRPLPGSQLCLFSHGQITASYG
jgi:hypothetical protein